MQNKKFRQFLAAALSIVMVLSLFVVPAAAEGTADPGTYTFDATRLADVASNYGGKEGYGDQEPVEATEMADLFDGYFTIADSVVKRSAKPQKDKNGVPSVEEDKLDFSVMSVEVAKNGGGAINFTVTGTATVTVSASSTGGSNTSDVALMKGATAVTEKTGKATVTGITGEDFVYENLTAGTYSVKSVGGSNATRGARIYTITVVQTAAEEADPTPAPTAEAPADPTPTPSAEVEETKTPDPATSEIPAASEVPAASETPAASKNPDPATSETPVASKNPDPVQSENPAPSLDWPKSAPKSGTFVLDAGEVFTATADNAAFRAAENNGSAGRYNLTQDAVLTWGNNDFFAIFNKTTTSGPSAGHFRQDLNSTTGEASPYTFPAGTDSLGEDYAEYVGACSINFADKAKFIGDSETTAGDTPNAVIGFAVGAPAVVRVWWRSAGSSTRTMGLVIPDATVTGADHKDDLGAKVLAEGADDTSNGKTNQVSAFEIEEAGTYYVGGVRNSNLIYRVEVIVGNGEPEVEPTPVPSSDPTASQNPAPSQDPTASQNPAPSTPATNPTTAAGKALQTAIKAANTEVANKKVSTDGTDVSKSKKWVTQDVMDAFKADIAAAQAVLDNADATDEQLTAAKEALETKTATFKAAGEYGTKKASAAGGSIVGTTTTPVTQVGTTNTVNPDGTAVTTTKDKDGNVDITVKTEDGDVLAEIKLPATAAAPETGFVDVPEGHWAEAAINEMAALGMVNGVNEDGTVFDMTSSVNRASIAAMLHRLTGNKAGAETAFADVAADAWYAADVAWAAKSGVVNGYDANTFGPNDTITRQQLAVMLARLARLAGVDTEAHASALEAFVDGADTADWATAGMAWCVKTGIVKGKGADTLDPTAAVSRAEAAVMIDRMIALLK